MATTTYRPLGSENIAISYSAGTFTVLGTGGRALSSSNPGLVTMPSQTAGQLITIPVTANQDFIDDAGASEIIGNLFGLTTGRAHASQMPFFLYAVINDAETAIAFMISRVPHLTVSPAAANIGAPDDAVANAQNDMWSLENIDETLYDANPSLCLGSFSMTMSAADDWTVQALTDGDGIGQFNDKKLYAVSAGHFGAASGKFFKDNGGTAPQWASNSLLYFIDQSGFINLNITFSNPSTMAGAVTMQLAAPYIAFNNSNFNQRLSGGYFFDNGTSSFYPASAEIALNTTNVSFIVDPIRATGNLQNADLGASDALSFTFRYKAN